MTAGPIGQPPFGPKFNDPKIGSVPAKAPGTGKDIPDKAPVKDRPNMPSDTFHANTHPIVLPPDFDLQSANLNPPILDKTKDCGIHVDPKPLLDMSNDRPFHPEGRGNSNSSNR